MHVYVLYSMQHAAVMLFSCFRHKSGWKWLSFDRDNSLTQDILCSASKNSLRAKSLLFDIKTKPGLCKREMEFISLSQWMHRALRQPVHSYSPGVLTARAVSNSPQGWSRGWPSPGGVNPLLSGGQNEHTYRELIFSFFSFFVFIPLVSQQHLSLCIIMPASQFGLFKFPGEHNLVFDL